jgi:hypothetical protein
MPNERNLDLLLLRRAPVIRSARDRTDRAPICGDRTAAALASAATTVAPGSAVQQAFEGSDETSIGLLRGQAVLASLGIFPNLLMTLSRARPPVEIMTCWLKLPLAPAT